MLKVHIAVEMQLAACTCNLPTFPSNLKPRNLTLIGPMGFPSRGLNKWDQSRLHLCTHSLLLVYTFLSFAYHRGGTEVQLR